MTVEVVADPAQLLEPGDADWVVEEIADYVPAIRRIKHAVAAEESLRVVVRHRACAVWLERFATSYSDAVVRCSRVAARDLLAELWRTEIPAHVTDEAILTSGFLQADIVPRTGQSYEEIVLEHYWGEFFTFLRFPLRVAGELIGALEPSLWQTNLAYPLVMQALHTRRQLWMDDARRADLKDLIIAVFDEPAEIRDRLGRYKLVRGYPSKVGQAVLDNWYQTFKNLAIDPTPLDLEGLNVAGTVYEIQYHLNKLSPSIATQADLQAVVDEMSGFLIEEFDWLLAQLREKSELLQPGPQLLEGIAGRFLPIKDQIDAELSALERSIAPAYPSDPAHNESIEEWLRWAVAEYLPYRFWMEENDRWDETVAEYAGLYADWFYENYVTNKYEQQNRWVFDLLNEARTSLAAERKVLFIIVDNFNFKYADILLQQFNRQGFRLVGEVQPAWAPIPTTTEVSKWSLVAGEADLSQVQGRNYDDILEKDWQGCFRGYQVAYLSTLGDMKKRRHFNENLILLNYLPIDTVLHKDEEQIATTHTSEIESYIRTLVRVVSEFAKRANVEQGLDIFVTSDHGSTKVPRRLAGPLDDRLYREQAQDRHHRYITVPEERALKPTAYDQEHCYIVPAKTFGNREHYFIARGYDRFIQTRESVYVHGGLTPEETIVPFCKLIKIEVEVLQPTIRLPDNVVRYSVKAHLAFVVGNPNDSAISSLQLSVAESDLPGVVVPAIPPGVSAEITVPALIKRRPGVPELDTITLQGSFELHGNRVHLQDVNVPVEARSLMDTKTDLDFEF
jgi:hypothetical protein